MSDTITNIIRPKKKKRVAAPRPEAREPENRRQARRGRAAIVNAPTGVLGGSSTNRRKLTEPIE